MAEVIKTVQGLQITSITRWDMIWKRKETSRSE